MRPEPYDQAAHYGLIASWWKEHGSEPLPADVLPPRGVVIVDGERPIAASFCYLMDGCSAAYIAFTVTEPNLRAALCVRAAQAAIEGAIEIARDAGCKMIWSATTNAVVDRIYTERCGFTRSTPHQNYFQMLDPAVSHEMLVGFEFEPKG